MRDKIILFPIPIEELECIIKECFNTELKKTIPLIKTKEEDVLLSRKEAANLLGVSLGTLSTYCKSGVIISYRIGSLIRFKKSQVMGSLKEMKALKYSRNN